MSHIYMYSENNFIGLIILLIIFLNIKSNGRKMTPDKKLYLGIIGSTSIIMTLDIILDILHRRTGLFAKEINITMTILYVIYFLLNVVPYIAWSFYVDFYIHRSVRRLKKIGPIIAMPAALSIILVIMSIFNKKIFFIDENNAYNRGSLFLFNTALYYSYLIMTYIQIVVKRKNIMKRDYYAMLTFGLIPAIAGVLQMIYIAKTFIWLGISISSLIIFLTIQSDEINKDYLTGLYNRRQLDIYLRNSIRDLKNEELLFMIMLDLNYFKTINDTYGHLEGDEALKHTANILINSFRSEDFISRYAGDEFVVIVKLEDLNCKDKIISRLKRNFEVFNRSNITPYELEFSLGCDIYQSELKINAEDFILHTDKLMYKDKARKKRVKCEGTMGTGQVTE